MLERGKRCASGFLTGKEISHTHRFFYVTEREEKPFDTGLVRGKGSRVKGRERAEMRRPKRPSRVGGAEMAAARGWGGGGGGFLCLCWHREGQRSCCFVGTEEARGNDNTLPFCYCVGEGEKDGGIILMA